MTKSIPKNSQYVCAQGLYPHVRISFHKSEALAEKNVARPKSPAYMPHTIMHFPEKANEVRVVPPRQYSTHFELSFD
jgi:hypothetical protein